MTQKKIESTVLKLGHTQTYRQTEELKEDKKTDGQMDRQTHRHTHRLTLIIIQWVQFLNDGQISE